MSCDRSYGVELFAVDEDDAVFWESSPSDSPADCSGGEYPDESDRSCAASDGGVGGGSPAAEAPAMNTEIPPAQAQTSSASRISPPLAMRLLPTGR